MLRRTKEKKRSMRLFSMISKTIIMVFQLMAFGSVWFSYYNRYAFRTHRMLGGMVSLLVFMILYNALARLYRAYKVGQYPIGEIIFSQLLAFGIADLILYVECCLIARIYVNISYGIIAVLIQLMGVSIWAVLAKRYYINNIQVPDTLIIYGADDVNEFEAKLVRKYGHLFNIKQKVSSESAVQELLDAINACETVLLYEVAYGRRTLLMSYCINEKKTFYITPRISDIVMEGFESRHMIDTPLLKYEYSARFGSGNGLKRMFDVVVSLFGLIVVLPIMLITALAIKLEDGGKVLFTQERYTRDWKKFQIYKFRSMVENADSQGALVCQKDDNRVTRVGKVIRRFRVDELPQLLNVLKGDMSIVGPRPERIENVEEYTRELPQFAYRLRVKGGLTGYAQIYGKYNTSAYDKLKLDLMYIENQSFFMDLKIMMLTIKMIFVPESTEGFAETSVKEDNKVDKKCQERN